jgi:membrane protease YdiL (CAAX protease family)
MNRPPDSKVGRNVIILYAGTLLLAIAAGLILRTGQDSGGLLFIFGPLLMVLVVRFLLGDGWKDAGLGLQCKGNWRWYLFALLLFPVVILVVISVNVLVGCTTLALPVRELVSPLRGGFAQQLIPSMIFAVSEEWAWRGYLEPRFASLGIPAVRRHVTVGALWGPWHFPYILSSGYTSAPIGLFLPLFMIGIIFLALIYGKMRSSSGSVWPGVLMHGMSNAVAFPIIAGKTRTNFSEVSKVQAFQS